MNAIEIFKEGGFVMLPLLLCSFVIWMIFFEKIYFLSHFQKKVRSLVEKANPLIKQNKIEEAKSLAHDAHPLIALPFLLIFDDCKDKSTLELEKWEGQVSRRLKETQMGLKRYLWILGTIGSLSPFIGLFGTVVGIIKSFENISAAGKGGFAVVAEGLGEALIATAAGIIVAVIAVAFYNYFQSRLAVINIELKHQLEDLRDMVV